MPDNLGNFSCEIVPHLIRQYVLIRTEADAPDNLLNMENGAASLINSNYNKGNFVAVFLQQFYHYVVMVSVLKIGLNGLDFGWLVSFN